MCTQFTTLAESNNFRYILQCEHGTIHLSWDLVTLYLNLSEFEHLVGLLERGTRLAEPSKISESSCILSYKKEGYYQLWVRNIAINLTPIDFLILVDLVRVVLLSPAALARFTPYRQPTTHLRELLVCTHGSRDVCCGKFGFPAFHILRQHAVNASTPLRVWRTSNFAGHRFAPTVLDLPDGRCWGHLETEVLENLARRSGQVSWLRPFYRGWSGLSVYEQVAEREVFMRQGWWWVNYLKDIQTLEFDEAEKRAEIWLSYTTPDSRISGVYQATVAFSHQVSTLSRTGDRQPLSVKQYMVTRLEKVFENPAALKMINGRNKKRYELHWSES